MLSEPNQIATWHPGEYEPIFRSLARRMLSNFPCVRRWEETDDIVQESILRLHSQLRSFRPESPLHARRMIALQIRRQLLDLSRHYACKSNYAANHESRYGEPIGTSTQPSLEEWCHFHQQVELLPDTVRETFELAWYAGMSQEAIARELEVGTRQIQRRLRTARIMLAQNLCFEALLSDC